MGLLERILIGAGLVIIAFSLESMCSTGNPWQNLGLASSGLLIAWGVQVFIGGEG
jgi:hypothetical protein